MNERFRYVLDNGSLSDFAGLMEVTGPLPEVCTVLGRSGFDAILLKYLISFSVA